jgi:NAD(P)H-flavin reductase
MIERARPQKCTATVLAKEKISSKVYQVTFKLKEPSTFSFLPGQTFMWHLSPGINRSMSLASDPADPTTLMMVNDISPMGPGSQRTLALNVGDEMSFIGPLGIFFLDHESTKKKIFVATGTGVAPFRSMLLKYLKQGGTDDVTLYWGLRYEEDIFWLDELLELSREYANFRFVLTLSRPTDGWQGKRGRVTDHVFVDESHLAGSDVYLCGNKAMVDEMEEKLAAAGVPTEQVKKELFF